MSTTRNRKLREQALERDAGKCRACGRYDPKAQVDHIVDLQFGGKDELDNLQTLCRVHHTEKTSDAAPKRAKADRLADRHQLMKRRMEIG